MTDSIKLTQLELVLLQLVAKGEGKWGWYELANALSRRDVPREPDMMVVLKKMAADGLVKEYVQSGSPRDRWELTPAGASILSPNSNMLLRELIVDKPMNDRSPTRDLLEEIGDRT
ncbi:hypothetical protein [Argonema galeatum]|uniref:hypothetical protein n=1 Tax=Argonema galeatum TaxID=2942762 RepID=UPI002011637C|nr:hypothetical protein [Argonema galeatum]MCL1462919.1 hypothetical protein [Argonema galeatum A003/A1]